MQLWPVTVLLRSPILLHLSVQLNSLLTSNRADSIGRKNRKVVRSGPVDLAEIDAYIICSFYGVFTPQYFLTPQHHLSLRLLRVFTRTLIGSMLFSARSLLQWLKLLSGVSRNISFEYSTAKNAELSGQDMTAK